MPGERDRRPIVIFPHIKTFSRAWWISLFSASCVFGLLTYLVLRWFGAVDDDRLVLYLVLGIAMGDVLLALSFELTTPTQVMVGPGERRTAHCELAETAVVVSGFEDSPEGQVRIRGELWSGRHAGGLRLSLAPGTEVGVVGRDGLILLLAESSGTH
ncbi:MAG: NfeD family protein [Chromatiales bacterium]|nr:NfeD family protein [Chromatiales bacterium]